jgi:hypothetical protein
MAIHSPLSHRERIKAKGTTRLAARRNLHKSCYHKLGRRNCPRVVALFMPAGTPSNGPTIANLNRGNLAWQAPRENSPSFLCVLDGRLVLIGPPESVPSRPVKPSQPNCDGDNGRLARHPAKLAEKIGAASASGLGRSSPPAPNRVAQSFCTCSTLGRRGPSSSPRYSPGSALAVRSLMSSSRSSHNQET